MALSFALVPPILAEPLKLDSDTLLLAGFNGRGDKADYANGWGTFGGGGYTQVDGYYGKGIDLRGIKLPDDIWKTENAFYPHYSQWIFWPRGNVNFHQGTLEFWLQTAPADAKRPATGGADLIHFQSYQPLRPKKDSETGTFKVIQPYVRLNARSMSWLFVTLSGKVVEGRVDFSKIPGWKKPLSPDQWHHFCLQWSPEGIGVYLDGRLVGSHPLEGDFGLALTGPTQRGLAVNGTVVDEFRISSVPRYGNQFEPNWREETRPENAFPGAPDVAQIDWKSRPNGMPLAQVAAEKPRLKHREIGDWQLSFDEKSGSLVALKNGALDVSAGDAAAGLLLWRGVEREPMATPKVSGKWKQDKGGLSFEQHWGGNLTVKHTLRPGEKGEVVWSIDFANGGSDRLWLEALMALPVMPTAIEFFDMSWAQTDLPQARRRDDYLFSLPMVAASDGKAGIGTGMNPHHGASALIGEWLPKAGSGTAPMIRQGTRVALAPGEKQSLEFVIFRSDGEFGVRDALAAFHSLYPELYKISEKAPIYSSMSIAQYFAYVNVPDLTRVYYTGGQWGHGPYHTKGNYLGDEKFWGRQDLLDREDYQHGLRNEQRFKTRENLFKAIVQQSKESFDNYYTPRRSHDLPNMPARFIVEEIMPGVEFTEDVLTAGQYFAPKNFVVNEFNTPLGEKFKNDQLGIVRLIGQYSPGFINDFCQSSSMRFTDPVALKSPGRAFSEDRGEYLIGAFGSVDRYQTVSDFSTNGHHQSTISDWGMISYMLSAHSVANAFESGCPFVSTTGMRLGLQASRNLLGEKPISVLTSYGLDNIGSQFEPEDFTPEGLRDYYRYSYRRLMLTALETGYYVDPPLLHGKQWNSEVNPVLVESMVYGRKTVPGGTVAEPLWLVRSGEGGKSVLVVGNSSAKEQASLVTLHHSYFGGRLLWTPYFGGSRAQSVGEKSTVLNPISIPAHDIAANKPVARLHGKGAVEAVADWSGDGLEIDLKLKLNATSDERVEILLPAEFYSIAEVTADGKVISADSEGFYSIPAGESVLAAKLRNTVLKFGSKEWDAVDLIKDGATNFYLIGSTKPGYENGTASQLNHFLRQYDEEDGVLGNLVDAAIYEEAAPKDYAGWVIDVRPDAAAKGPAVSIDSDARKIRLSGKIPGEVRQGMMLLMRLVDRKYVHIGRNVPMDRNLRIGWKKPGWHGAYNEKDAGWKRLYERRPKTREFFEKFEDQNFLWKPILEREYEPLYAENNLDFAGKYTLKHSPHLLEPTFSEDYIYGYNGPRADEP